ERRFHEVDGARIETLVWGEAGRPGLLFLHGNAAHADWWSFIAPFFLPQYRVVALSWSGMGSSEWRDEYSLDGFVAEALMIAEAERLFSSASKPVVVSHTLVVVLTASRVGHARARTRSHVVVNTATHHSPR